MVIIVECAKAGDGIGVGTKDRSRDHDPHRLLVSNLAEAKTERDICAELKRKTFELVRVITNKNFEDFALHRGFCFLDDYTRAVTVEAKRWLSRNTTIGCRIIVDWGDLKLEFFDGIMAAVRILSFRQYSDMFREEIITKVFGRYGTTEIWGTLNTYSFTYFIHQGNVFENALGGIKDVDTDISTDVLWTKQSVDRQHRTRMTRNRELSIRNSGHELYVRQYGGTLSEEVLTKVFGRYGTVKRVKNLRNHSFVQFARREDAQSAMEALDGATDVVTGVSINVLWAKSRADKQHRERMPRNRELRIRKSVHELFVRQYCGTLSEEVLTKVFGRYGAVKRVKNLRNHSFVQFARREDAQSAMEALDGATDVVTGVSINVLRAKSRVTQQHRERMPRNPELRIRKSVHELFVRQYGGTLSEEVLTKVFGRYGTVKRVKNLRNHSFVQFARREDAQSAMEALDGATDVVTGVSINVLWAKSRADKHHRERMPRNRELRIRKSVHELFVRQYCGTLSKEHRERLSRNREWRMRQVAGGRSSYTADVQETIKSSDTVPTTFWTVLDPDVKHELCCCGFSGQGLDCQFQKQSDAPPQSRYLLYCKPGAPNTTICCDVNESYDHALRRVRAGDLYESGEEIRPLVFNTLGFDDRRGDRGDYEAAVRSCIDVDSIILKFFYNSVYGGTTTDK
ncbi:RNA recognition motif domain [Cinara cedri]|uniref:RNA recognition motif domain n=1 Tax=Cinara cedri TaxID=506608 RepID=A0A5E4NAR3_9HEMI|nr:RNA recognition motif domain [Cinara cedri]